jgi:peroxiredoxin
VIAIGDKCPPFVLPNQDGRTVRLEDFAGRWLVIYVYPKDDTPGCTLQGQSFTASKTVVVDPIGVVRKVYTKVKPDGHDRALLADLEALQAGG